MAGSKSRYPAPPTEPQRLISGQSQLDIVASHTRAGFTDIPRAVIFRRYYQYLEFLQQHDMTTRVIVASVDVVSDKTEL